MKNNLRLFFLGDFYCNEIDRIEIADEIRTIICSSDVNICNFEAPVLSQGKPSLKSGPNIRQSRDAPAFLEKIGFNVCSLANNHIMDYGEEGLKKTISLFKKSLLVGAGTIDNAYQVKTMVIKGYTIGFLALSHNEFGVLDDDNQNNIGCAWINHPCVNHVIANAKKMVDYLFILSHAGVENISIPLPEWRQRYQDLIDCGADAVIASHPHIPQGWERCKEKPIFYSLGNFYFDRPSKVPYANIGLGVLFEINDKGYIKYTVCPLKKEGWDLNLSNDPKIWAYLKECEEILKQDSKYLLEVNKQVVNLWTNIYKYYFYYSLRKISFQFGFYNLLKTIYRAVFYSNNYVLLLNNIRCESHRWAIVRAIKLLYLK